MPYQGPGFTAPQFPTSISAFANSPFGPNWERPQIMSHELVLQGGGGPGPLNLIICETVFGRNGLELLTAYQADELYKTQGSFEDNATDLRIYYEQGGGKLFANICYVAMNKAVLAYLKGNSSEQSPEYVTDGILEADRRTHPAQRPMNRKRLLEAIQYEIAVGNAGPNAAYYVAMKLLHAIAEAIRLQKPTEKNWDADRKDYDPLFGLEGLTTLTNGWDTLKKKLDLVETGLKEGAAWLRRQPIVLEDVATLLDTVAKLWHNLVAAIDEVAKGIKELVKIVRYVNAFVCGVLAEVLDMIAAIADLIALLVYLAKDKLHRDVLKKSIEQIVKEVVEHPETILVKVREKIAELKQRYDSEKNSEWALAYSFGEDVVTVFVFIDGMVAVVNTFIKTGEKILSVFDKLGEWVRKMGKRLKKVGSRGTVLSKEILELSAKISKAVAGKTVMQLTKNLDELYEAAKTANTELEAITNKFARETGGKAGLRPKNVNGGLKDKARAIEKVAEYDDASYFLDVVRNKVVYNTIDDLYRGLIKFEILRFKDRIQDPLPNGYRDILMNIKMENGYIVKFRLHLKAMDEAAAIEHDMYKVSRAIDAKVLKEKRSFIQQELKIKSELFLKSKEIFDKAWQKI